MYDVATGQQQQVAAHDAPIKCIKYLQQGDGMIVTAGWDKKLKVGPLWWQSPGIALTSAVLGSEDAQSSWNRRARGERV
jgi:hypothetical protein